VSMDEMTDVETCALLRRALDTEPVVHLHPESVLALARRSRARRRLAVAGSLVVAVATVVVGSTVLAGGHSPATGVDLATAPMATSKYRNPTAAPDAPLAVDDRSRRLTEVLTNAHVIPPGMRVEDPGEPGDPMVFGTSIVPSDAPRGADRPKMYVNKALLADARGSGALQIAVSEDKSVLYDARDVTCGAFREKTTCEERTLPGGIKAVAVTRLREVGATLSQRFFVYAARANGSYVMVYVDNGCDCDPDNPHPAVTRDVPPLDLEAMFRIAGLPGMEY
jgi:hypothetical protein